MATVKDWLNQKFSEWEKAQGGRQSYYAFSRYLEVSQSGLAAWMTGGDTPLGDDLIALAEKLGPEIYDVIGLPRPNVEVQRVTVSFASLPVGIRQNLTGALSEIDQELRAQRLRSDSAQAHQAAVEIFARWGFRYTK